MKAKTKIYGVYADCPECDGDLIDPNNGSTVIVINFYNQDQLFMCLNCRKEFKLESKAWRMK